jgi:copper resistance protein D
LDNGATITICFVIARSVHIGACLLLLGVWAFDRFTIGEIASRFDFVAQGSDRIVRRTSLIALSAAALSGVAWFVLVVAGMSGLPLREAVRFEPLRIVWSGTQFGLLWQIRSVLLLVAIALTIWDRCSTSRARVHSVVAWLAVLSNGGLVASLAWSGHGQTGRFNPLHLSADVIHLLAASLWPAGLVPFGLLIAALRRRRDDPHWTAISLVTRRFSAMCLISVSALTLSGLVSGCCLIGSARELFTSSYGKWLLAKIALFAMMVGLGAVNLLYVKPRLSHNYAVDSDAIEISIARLGRNVAREIVLGTAVIIIVGILGMLPPPRM